MTSTVTQRYVAPENMKVISYKAYIIITLRQLAVWAC